MSFLFPAIRLFFDQNGAPLEDGYVYIGEASMDAVTNPIQVYWDSALTQPATQPIRTISGYPTYQGTPSALYISAGSCSITVKNKNLVPILTNIAGEQLLTASESFKSIATIAALKALTNPSTIGQVWLKQAGREGFFIWDGSDLSTEVTADPYNGIYVAPSSDATGASGAWVRRYIGPLQASWFCECDGVTDDAAAMRTAILFAEGGTGGGTILLPSAIIKFSSAVSITGNVVILGLGTSSRIFSSSATEPIFSIDSPATFDPGVIIEDIYFYASVTRTAGAFISSSGTDGVKVRRCQLNGAYNGFLFEGDATQGIEVEQCFLFGTLNIGIFVSAATGSQGITLSSFRNNVFFGTSDAAQTPVAMYVLCAGDLTVEGNQSLYCSSGLVLIPPTGRTIQLLRSLNNTWDSGDGSGIVIVPVGGTIHLAKFINEWCATFDLDGVSITDAGSSTINKLSFCNCACGNNGGNGINAATTSIAAIDIIGGDFGSNAGSGVNIVANLTKFRIIQASFGVTGQWSDNTGYDILINAGTSDDYFVVHNLFTTGGLGAFSDGGSGSNKVVTPNLTI